MAAVTMTIMRLAVVTGAVVKLKMSSNVVIQRAIMVSGTAVMKARLAAVTVAVTLARTALPHLMARRLPAVEMASVKSRKTLRTARRIAKPKKSALRVVSVLLVRVRVLS